MSGINLNVQTMIQKTHNSTNSTSSDQEFFYSNDVHIFHITCITCEENFPNINARQNQMNYKVTCKTIPISLVANNLLKRPYTIDFSEPYKEYAVNYNKNEDKDTSCRIVVDKFDPNSNTGKFNATLIESESSQSDESETKITREYKEVPCKWNEDATKSLLAYLKTNKEEVIQLESRGIIAREVRETLWDNISTTLRKGGYIYSAEQCAIKWKNLKQNFKKKNKQNYNNNSKLRYNSEIEDILKDRRLSTFSDEKTTGYYKRKISAESSERPKKVSKTDVKLSIRQRKEHKGKRRMLEIKDLISQ
ncbi:13222_t:CDS:2 [Funneliformis geosporum]|nr:13222_t:CDS:2 [Funneliformis geosporum]